jgi:hypothetical protein
MPFSPFYCGITAFFTNPFLSYRFLLGLVFRNMVVLSGKLGGLELVRVLDLSVRRRMVGHTMTKLKVIFIYLWSYEFGRSKMLSGLWWIDFISFTKLSFVSSCYGARGRLVYGRSANRSSPKELNEKFNSKCLANAFTWLGLLSHTVLFMWWPS